MIIQTYSKNAAINRSGVKISMAFIAPIPRMFGINMIRQRFKAIIEYFPICYPGFHVVWCWTVPSRVLCVMVVLSSISDSILIDLFCSVSFVLSSNWIRFALNRSISSRFGLTFKKALFSAFLGFSLFMFMCSCAFSV